MSVTQSRPVVLHVLHSLDVGGAEILAARIARRLRERYEFVFACLDRLGTLGVELRNEGFRVEVLGRKSGIDVACVRKLARFAGVSRANLIHAHQYTPFFYSRAPGWFGRRVPVLFTEHGRMHPDLPNRKRMLFNRLFLRGRDRIVAVGEAVKTALIQNEAIPSTRIQVIYNGVCLDDFQTDVDLRARMRRELNILPQQPVAIQVARLDYLKDHCTALRAVERIRATCSDFLLLLVGEGPERAKIESEIEKRSLQANVRLLGLRSDVRQLLSAADLFLLTSISEGIPVTLIEAMAASLPIVSTAVGGVSEVVVEGETGLVLSAGDDEGLARQCIALAQAVERRTQFGENGLARVRSIFSESSMHEKYAARYDSMVARVCSIRESSLANGLYGISQ